MLPIDVVIVTYNSAHIIERAIKSIPPGANIIVVDNASKDSSVQIAQSLGAEVIQNKQNVGFGIACNQGAFIGNSEFILFLNPDARLRDGALEKLILAAERFPNVGGLNPRMLGEDGRQRFRKSSFLVPQTRAEKRHSRNDLPQEDRELKFLSGAALLCRRTAFEDIGGFDQNIFLYFEDDDLSVRLISSGWQLYYVHDAIVEHDSHAGYTSGETKMHFFKGYHWAIAQAYVAKKHAIYFPIRWNKFLMNYRSFIEFLSGRRSKAEFLRGRALGLNLVLKNRP
jgi:GT2 family glycosyltransferase